jgi:hypothetical protein
MGPERVNDIGNAVYAIVWADIGPRFMTNNNVKAAQPAIDRAAPSPAITGTGNNTAGGIPTCMGCMGCPFY